MQLIEDMAKRGYTLELYYYDGQWAACFTEGNKAIQGLPFDRWLFITNLEPKNCCIKVQSNLEGELYYSTIQEFCILDSFALGNTYETAIQMAADKIKPKTIEEMCVRMLAKRRRLCTDARVNGCFAACFYSTVGGKNHTCEANTMLEAVTLTYNKSLTCKTTF